MALKPKQNETKKMIRNRILAVVALIYCLFVLTTEAIVIINPEYTLNYFVNIYNGLLIY